MNCRYTDLKNKEVVSIKDGCCLGFVGDIEFDTETASVCSIVIFGKHRWFGLLGREDDCVICWNEIEVIGKDIILVNCREERREKHKRPGIIDSILGTN